jgi:hypothetical protein
VVVALRISTFFSTITTNTTMVSIVLNSVTVQYHTRMGNIHTYTYGTHLGSYVST